MMCSNDLYFYPVEDHSTSRNRLDGLCCHRLDYMYISDAPRSQRGEISLVEQLRLAFILRVDVMRRSGTSMK